MYKLIAGKLLSLCIPLLFFLLTVPVNSFSEEYAATVVADYNDVTVMEFEGDLNASAVGESYSAPLQAISREFYTTNGDYYDFLVIFSGFDFEMPETDKAAGFYSPVRNDVQGIGYDLFDNSHLYGSDGALQGVITMGPLKDTVYDPLAPEFTDTMTTLSHEILHRWAAFVRFQKEDGTTSTDLLGKDGAHWSFLLDTDGSLMYGNNWQDNGDGTFTALPGRKYYSKLDLYLMGLIDKSRVPPMQLIENPEIDPTRLPTVGETISGTVGTVTIEDIIAAEGERIPSAQVSQKQFRIGTVIIVRPGEQYQAEVGCVRMIMDNWPLWYSALTDGVGAVICDKNVTEDIPENPGVDDPADDPQAPPQDIADGINWLTANQNGDGSWQDTDFTMTRDTALALLTLRNFTAAEANCSLGMTWLSTVTSENSDFLAKTAEVLACFDEPLEDELGELKIRRNPDGGWGADEKKYGSNPRDTANVLRALTAGGASDPEDVGPAIDYLLSTQQADGGWGSDAYDSDVAVTAAVLSVLSAYVDAYDLEDAIQNGLACLLNRRNPDGGFGNSPSTVYDTTLALMAYKQLNGSAAVRSQAVSYILGQQFDNGSWDDSVLQTALAINSIWEENRQPDIVIETSDIAFTPPKLTSLPGTVNIHAEINNTSMADVPEVQVALYQGGISEAALVAEQIIAISASSATGVDFTVEIATGGTYYYYIVVDRDGLVDEGCETNNRAMKILYPDATYDFEILNTDISVSSSAADALDPVTITAKIRNKGAQDAFNVPINFLANGSEIAALTVSSLPAGEETTKSFTWKADKTGNVTLSADIDPYDVYSELDKTNNTGSIEITVASSEQANLSVSYQDIVATPATFREGGNVELAVNVENNGFSQIENINVTVYNGSPNEGGVIIGTSFIASIAAGEAAVATISWDNIPVSGDQIVFVEVNSTDPIDEITVDDNYAFLLVDVLSLPDLAISPAAITLDPSIAKEGDNVEVVALIQNAGEQDAEDVKVSLLESGTEIDTVQVDLIPGNDAKTAVLSYDTTGNMGAHEITVSVDPDNVITEQDDTNNTASRNIGVQDANLWLSERYLSPNGDGIKDVARFFFNLDQPQTVYVAIVNDDNVVVRRFTGAVFEDTTGGDIVWDGLNYEGRLVDDGPYQIQVRSENDSVIAALPITVDNNRSPLMEAVGTPYFYNQNITCKPPFVMEHDDWQWFSDESGIFFFEESGTPQYPTGLYTMDPDGGNITRLVPGYWHSASSAGEHSYAYLDVALNPNETGAVFGLKKSKDGVLEESQIWTVDRFGQNLTKALGCVYEQEVSGQTVYRAIESVRMSENGIWIAYVLSETWVDETNPDETETIKLINIVHPDGSGNETIAEIDTESDIDYLSWSPDNTTIFLVDKQDWNIDKLYFLPLAGSAPAPLEHEGAIEAMRWMNNGKLVVLASDQYGDFYQIDLVDPSDPISLDHIAEGIGGTRYHQLEVDFDPSVVMNPNGDGFAYIDYKNDAWTVNLIDGNGNHRILYETPFLYGFEGSGWSHPSLNDVRWSPEGDRITFVDYAWKRVEGNPHDDPCYTKSAFIVIDIDTFEKQVVEVDTRFTCEAAYSYHVYTGSGNDQTEAGVLHYSDYVTTQELDLSDTAVIDNGSLKLWITQQGLDGAYIYRAGLNVDGVNYPPSAAINVGTGHDVLAVMLSENDGVDAHEATFELTWENLPEDAGRLLLELTANETSFTYIDGSVEWMGDNVLVGTETTLDEYGYFEEIRPFGINLSDGKKHRFPPQNIEEFIKVSPLNNAVAYLKAVDDASTCEGYMDTWIMMSLLNLTAGLHAERTDSAIILSGTAMDQHFDHYVLEYADLNAPDTWELIQPPSETPVIDDVFGVWVPPATGSFYVRLTAFDKAGNSATRRSRVYWGAVTSIFDLYKTGVTYFDQDPTFSGDGEIFSPMTDSEKEAVALFYRVLAPVHLEFTVTDEAGGRVKTFEADYDTVPEDSQYIIWDGTDENGHPVPDGNYTISVFDYEFYTQVDRTPPAVFIQLSELDVDKYTGAFSADMRYMATDKNFAAWTVEWGEGQEPEEWIEYKSGNTPAQREGEPFRKVFDEGQLEFVVGKQFKITAADYAGNMATRATGFMEETILINRWEVPPEVNDNDIKQWLRVSSYEPPYYIIPYEPDVDIDVKWYFLLGEKPWWLILGLAPDSASSCGFFSKNRLPELFVEPGTHAVRGLESIRLPLSTLTFQHWGDSMMWTDGDTVDYPESGPIQLEWDNTAVEDTRVVRIKAADEKGDIYYSNMIIVKPLLEGMLDEDCNAWYDQFVVDGLDKLDFQMAEFDSKPFETYKTLSRISGDVMLNGAHKAYPLPDDIDPRLKVYRMVGVDIHGNEYISNVIDFNSCDDDDSQGDGGGDDDDDGSGRDYEGSLIIRYSPSEFECGQRSQSATLSVDYKEDLVPPDFQSVSYYLADRQENVLLGSGDFPEYSVNVPLQSMAEGVRKVSFVVEYGEDQSFSSDEDDPYLIIDRTPPTVKIGYPSDSARICFLKYIDNKGRQRYGLNVEGQALDDELGHWKLYYGHGEMPVDWYPALKPVRPEAYPPEDPELSGTSAVSGELGEWDLSDFYPGTYSLLLKADDRYGNVACYTTSGFYFDDEPVVRVSAPFRKVFSPNNDGVMDDTGFYYTLSDDSTVSITVSGNNTTTVLMTSEFYTAGRWPFTWDGSGFADGDYTILVEAVDSCGNQGSDETEKISIDTTPPQTVITTPGPYVYTDIEIESVGTAWDVHFLNYLLTVTDTAVPDVPLVLASEERAIQNGVLGCWNTFDLTTGEWILLLTAWDEVGNMSETPVTVELGERPELIKSLDVDQPVFSPNNDGAFDQLGIEYELNPEVGETLNISLTIVSNGQACKTIQTADLEPGIYNQTWNGETDQGSGGIVPDGTYKVLLSVYRLSEANDVQEASLTVRVDTTPPEVTMTSPVEGAFSKGDLPVEGTINDINLDQYRIDCISDTETLFSDQERQNRENYQFVKLDALPEGECLISVSAIDLAGNETELDISCTIDNTPPEVEILTPEPDTLFGGDFTPAGIKAVIAEENLSAWNLRYGFGEDPDEWQDLASDTSIPSEEKIYEWAVGPEDGVADGLYTLSLMAEDKAGWQREAICLVSVDNTVPSVDILSPLSGGYITEPVDITGNVQDDNLTSYAVSLSRGDCIEAAQWGIIYQGEAEVEETALATLANLPTDGAYCLKLTAEDGVGNTSAHKTDIIVDTQPPSAPAISVEQEDKNICVLSWAQVADEDVAGYNIFRDGEWIADNDTTETAYRDTGLTEGVYVYTVTAYDFAGWDSEPSNAAVFAVDLTGPGVKLSIPRDGDVLNDLVEIKGTAFSEDDFKQYRVYIGTGRQPDDWRLIRTSPVPIPYGVLADISQPLTAGTDYCIKLEAEDLAGNISTCQACFTIDDTAPDAPVLLSVTADISDVTITWQESSDSNVAGYLLYRNGELVNVDGPVVGSLVPYLLDGPTFNDSNLPDGIYEYYLEAVDAAGNISPPSNVMSVEIDTRAPVAVIVTPADGHKFEHPITIKAVCEDLDVAEIQIQYRVQGDGDWMNVSDPMTIAPYVAELDPADKGISYGIIQLRARSRDFHENEEENPAFISVEYTDLTPPAVPTGFEARVTGETIAFSWESNTEDDLAGYYIYEIGIDEDWSYPVNWSPITENTFTIENYYDGEYMFAIQAVDTYENESELSGTIRVIVYTPEVEQPFTPVCENSVTISGAGVVPESTVTVTVDSQVIAVVDADVAGGFTAEFTLSEGEKSILVKAEDVDGNISKEAEVIVIYSLPPTAPVNPETSVSGYDCTISWDAHSENDVIGYQVFRDGQQLNPPVAQTSGTTSADNSDYFGPIEHAFDNDPATYWMGYLDMNEPEPNVWWQLRLPSEMLITTINLTWFTPEESGRDFDLLVWTGEAWLTYARFADNEDMANTISFEHPYPTDKIRLMIYDTNGVISEYGEKYVSLAEFSVTRAQLIPESTFLDQGLGNGTYDYEISAIDAYGFESPVSDPVTAVVGDNELPAAPTGLSAQVIESDVTLSWEANTETDLAGYHVYRQSDGEWTVLSSEILTETAFTDANVINGSHTYRVTAVDEAGNESPPAEVAAVVAVAVPDKPEITSITTSPEGSAILVCWMDPSDTAAGYNLYRSETPGGPYTKINDSPVVGTCYTDNGPVNDVTYYYTVTAVDENGNESEFAEENEILPQDLTPLTPPDILQPTVPGMPLSVSDVEVDVSGTAETGSTVELYRNGGFVDAVPVGTEPVQSYQIVHGRYVVEETVLSPDENFVAYVVSEQLADGSFAGLYVMDVASGAVRTVREMTGTAVEISSRKNMYSTIQWSPDGSRLAYATYQTTPEGIEATLEYLDLNAAQPVVALQPEVSTGIVSFQWSSDSNRLAYTLLYESEFLLDVFIYDIEAGTNTSINENTTEFFINLLPAFSHDGDQTAFFGITYDGVEVCRVDLQTRELVDLSTAPGDNVCMLRYSPDDDFLSYVITDEYVPGAAAELIVLDAATGETVTVISNLYSDGVMSPFIYDWYRWSSSARQLLYLSDDGGVPVLYVYDVAKNQSTPLVENVLDYDWDVSGKQAQVLVADSFGVKARSVPVDFPERIKTIAEVDDSVGFIRSAVSGGAWLVDDFPVTWTQTAPYPEETAFYRVFPGVFSFDQVGLEPGDNVFQAVSVGENNDVSPWSESIKVILQPDTLPDIRVSADDFFVYPVTPRRGETVLGNVVVTNAGSVAAGNVPVTITAVDGEGDRLTIVDTVIDDLPGGSGKTVEFNWDSSNRSGEYTFRVVVDPMNIILENDENNNTAVRRIFVTGEYGAELSAELDDEQYIRGQQVVLRADIANSGPAVNADLEIWVTDTNGDTVFERIPETLAMEYGDVRQVEYEFETIDIYEGEYTAHVRLSEAETILNDAVIPFTINPDVDLAASLTTDRSAYGADQVVELDYRIKNNGVSGFDASQGYLYITDAGNNEVFGEDLGKLQILSGERLSGNIQWNTGLNVPGTYQAGISVYDSSGTLIAAADTLFEIVADATVTGSLLIDPVYVLPGTVVDAEYTLYNNGNSPAVNVPVEIVLLHPVTGAVIDVFQETVNIAANDGTADLASFDTTPLALSTYTITLRTDYNGGMQTLASGTFTVADAAPPELTIVSPQEDNTYHDTFYLTVDVFDSLSAVAGVSYSIDGGDWLPIPSADLAGGRYSIRFTPATDDEGTRIFRFLATDSSHNTPEDPIEVTVHIVPRVDIFAALENDTFGMHEPVTGEITLTNTGWEKPVSVVSAVETAAGQTVAAFGPDEIVLAEDGAEVLAFAWNSGAVTSGDYRLRTRVVKDGEVLDEVLVPFVIAPVLNLSLNAAIGQAEYGLHEDVNADITVTSLGNYAVAPTIILDVVDSQNQVMHTDQATLPPLGHGDVAVHTCVWNTGANQPGTYRVRAKALVNSQVVCETEAPFVVTSVVALNGTVTTAATVPLGQSVQAHYTLTNTGNVSLTGLALELSMAEKDTGLVVTTHADTLDLEIGQDMSADIALETTGLSLKTYQLTLTAVYAGAAYTLGRAEVALTDSTPPQLTVILPQPDDVFNAPFMLRAEAVDDASGVALVQYRFDAGTWQVMPHTGSDQYAAEYTPVETDVGVHAVFLRATDGAGNMSVPQELTIHIVPGVTVTANLGADTFGMHEAVSGEIVLVNVGWEKQVGVATAIETATGDPVASFDPDNVSLAVDGTATLDFAWNTGAHPSGNYRLNVQVNGNANLHEEAIIPFTISPEALVEGTLTADATVSPGDPVQAGYTLTNTGNVSLTDLPVTLSLVDADTGQAVATHETAIDLGIGQEAAGSNDLDTSDLAVKTYSLTLSVTYEQTVHVLARSDVTLTDNAVPTVTVISPQPGDVFNAPFMLEADVVDDASGIDLVEYRFDQGDWLPLPHIEDDRYAILFTPAEADAGDHLVSFRATDRAGNLSQVQSVGIFIEFFQAFRELTGVLTLAPARVLQEAETDFCYVITNPTDEGIENLTIRVDVNEPDSGLTLTTLEKVTTIDAGGVLASNFEWTATDITPGTFTVALSVALDAPIDPRALDEAELEVLERPEVTVDQQIDQQGVSLLVWLNDDCHMVCSCKSPWWWHCGSKDCHWEGCVREDLLEAVLDQAVFDYRIVTDMQDFAKELRNPYYTDVLVLGDRQRLDCKTTAEVMERVNGGLGIISSKWFQHTVDVFMPLDITSIFSVRTDGLSYVDDFTVTTVSSPVCDEGTIVPEGGACKVAADSDAIVAGWIETDHKCCYSKKSPAIVLSEYGRARTVYFAFDLALTLENDYDRIAAMLTNAVQYVHGDRDTFAPWDMVPVVARIGTTTSDYNYTVTQTYDEALKLYDPISGSWITDNPWQLDVDLEPDQTKEVRFYYLMPDMAGTFAVETETGLNFGNDYIPLDNSPINLSLDADRMDLYNRAISHIRDLDVSFWERFTIYAIVKKLEFARDRSIHKRDYLKCNIYNIINATHSLMLLCSADTTDVRLELNTLLKLEQGRYYLYEK